MSTASTAPSIKISTVMETRTAMRQYGDDLTDDEKASKTLDTVTQPEMSHREWDRYVVDLADWAEEGKLNSDDVKEFVQPVLDRCRANDGMDIDGFAGYLRQNEHVSAAMSEEQKNDLDSVLVNTMINGTTQEMRGSALDHLYTGVTNELWTRETKDDQEFSDFLWKGMHSTSSISPMAGEIGLIYRKHFKKSEKIDSKQVADDVCTTYRKQFEFSKKITALQDNLGDIMALTAEIAEASVEAGEEANIPRLLGGAHGPTAPVDWENQPALIKEGMALLVHINENFSLPTKENIIESMSKEKVAHMKEGYHQARFYRMMQVTAQQTLTDAKPQTT